MKNNIAPADFWRNPLRDKDDPILFSAISAANNTLSGWHEKDAAIALSEIRLFCKKYRVDHSEVKTQSIQIGENVYAVGDDNLLLLFHLYEKKPDVQWIARISNQNILAVLILNEAKQRDASAARRAGYLLIKMQEPNIIRGQKVISAAELGHEIQHGTKEDKEKRWGEYQNEVDRLYVENKRLSYADIQRKVAAKFGVSDRTIRNHTTNPKKS